MLNRSVPTSETFLKSVFESGYSNAALSLSNFIPDKITDTNFHFGFHKFEKDEQSSLPSFNRTETYLLITTEIFGDITGKSYLFLSEHDVNALTKRIYESANRVESLKDEFLKELDNILSASVITKISNKLGIKIFGDIPILVGRTRANINAIITDDFAEQTDEIYVNSTFFTFENHPTVSPFFVWVLDGNIQNTLQEKSVMKKAS